MVVALDTSCIPSCSEKGFPASGLRREAFNDVQLIHEQAESPVDGFLFRVDPEIAASEVDLALMELEVFVLQLKLLIRG